MNEDTAYISSNAGTNEVGIAVPMLTIQPDYPVVTAQEAALILRVPVDTLPYFVQQGLLPEPLVHSAKWLLSEILRLVTRLQGEVQNAAPIEAKLPSPVTALEFANALGLCVRTFRTKRRQGLLPTPLAQGGNGRRLTWSRPAVEQYLREGLVVRAKRGRPSKWAK